MKKACLMIMQAREIPESIRSFRLLKGIDKAYFRGYTEAQLATEIPKFVQNTNYDFYLINSDDVIVTQSALEAVLAHAKPTRVVGGWCRFNPKSDKVAIRLRPFLFHQFIYPLGTIVRSTFGESINSAWWKIKERTFSTVKTIERQEEVFPVFWLGWNLCCMSREMWLKYPFQVYNGRWKAVPQEASDIMTFERLVRDKVQVYCIRSAEIIHLASRDFWLIGKVQPSVILERDEDVQPMQIKIRSTQQRK
jgi:hypothetical protein